MCDLCRSTDPTAHVELHHNVGMLFMRRTHQTEGSLCSVCLGRSMWKHQVSNLVFGWWGVISFFITAYYLFDNTTQYFRARDEIARSVRSHVAPSEPSAVGTVGVAVDASVDAAERLGRFSHNVRLRLRSGESPDDIVEDLARTHAVAEDDARAFVATIHG